MTEYAWTREPKLGIIPARNPVDGLYLSGVVLVIEGGVGVANVKFGQETVAMIGKKMPHGIGPDTPALIKVVKKHGHYDVLCSYVNNSHTRFLWKTNALPAFIRKVHYADTKSDTAGRSTNRAA